MKQPMSADAVAYRLEASWPITDPSMALADLKAEALASLAVVLERLGARRTAYPSFTVTHGRRPALALAVDVLAPPGRGIDRLTMPEVTA